MPIRTTEELKRDERFDEIVAELITLQTKGLTERDRERVVEEVRQKINPRIHRELPDPKPGR